MREGREGDGEREGREGGRGREGGGEGGRWGGRRWGREVREGGLSVLNQPVHLHSPLNPWLQPPCVKLVHISALCEMASDYYLISSSPSTSQIVHLFIQSEQIYVDSLHALEFFYHEPLKTLSIFKPDVLGYTQLGALFLNW